MADTNEPGPGRVLAGRVLGGIEIDPAARIEHCRSCGQPIWWGKTVTGKSCPFDVDATIRTAQTHFSTCRDAKAWTKR